MVWHDRRLTTDQTAFAIDASIGDALDKLFEQSRIVFGHRHIIEEEQRFGSRAKHVVDAHGDKIDADRRMLLSKDRDFELGPNPIGPGDQNRLLVVAREKLLRKVQREQTGKASVVSHHPGGKGPMHQLRQATHGLFIDFQVDSAVFVCDCHSNAKR
jgi:hypothetical protein